MKVFPLGAFTCLDTETTGKDPEQARLIEIALALVVPGKPTDVRTQIADPGPDVEVPDEAAQVHGISTERARAEGKPVAEVLDVYLGDVALAVKAGMPLVIQNAPYDLTVLDREARRHGLPTLHDRLGDTSLYVLDPLVLDKRCIKFRRRVSPEQGARCLKTLAQVYRVPWDDDQAHGAEYDALVAARVVWRIGQWACMPRQELSALRVDVFDAGKAMHRNDVAAFQSLAELTLADLHAKQTQWYREQTESFGQWLVEQRNEWLAKAGNAATDDDRVTAEQEVADLTERIDGLSTDWPLRPFAAEGVPA